MGAVKKHKKELLNERKKVEAGLLQSDWSVKQAGNFGVGAANVHVQSKDLQKMEAMRERALKQTQKLAQKAKAKEKKRLEKLAKAKARNPSNAATCSSALGPAATFRGGIWEAAKAGNMEHLERAITEGRQAQFYAHHPETGTTPLHEAAAAGRNDAVKFLLALSAKIEAKDLHSKTPLFRSIEGHSNDTAILLVLSGADLHARADSGRSCYEQAASVDQSLADRLKKARGDFLIFQREETDRLRAAGAHNPTLSAMLHGSSVPHSALASSTDPAPSLTSPSPQPKTVEEVIRNRILSQSAPEPQPESEEEIGASFGVGPLVNSGGPSNDPLAYAAGPLSYPALPLAYSAGPMAYSGPILPIACFPPMYGMPLGIPPMFPPSSLLSSSSSSSSSS
ncbi:MAG: ankyrin repeat domain-containing protein, partial [archaeon]|nr:ankyrin repeat domain-containing protein [archaeon]